MKRLKHASPMPGIHLASTKRHWVWERDWEDMNGHIILETLYPFMYTFSQNISVLMVESPHCAFISALLFNKWCNPSGVLLLRFASVNSHMWGKQSVGGHASKMHKTQANSGHGQSQKWKRPYFAIWHVFFSFCYCFFYFPFASFSVSLWLMLREI